MFSRVLEKKIKCWNKFSKCWKKFLSVFPLPLALLGTENIFSFYVLREVNVSSVKEKDKNVGNRVQERERRGGKER